MGRWSDRVAFLNSGGRNVCRERCQGGQSSSAEPAGPIAQQEGGTA